MSSALFPRVLLRRWAASPAISGTVLLAASLLALALANSPLSNLYADVLHHQFGPVLRPFDLRLSVEHWIGDGLMALFFLSVTLEIKRELTVGHLNTVRQAALPTLGALGGMAGPALVYLACAWGEPGALHGWAVPVATDAAFMLPLLAALGTRVSAGVRAFLIALAIFDDVLAILIIALFYSGNLSWGALQGAATVLAVLVALNLAGVRRLWPYAAGGASLWVALLQTGVHATLAGVLLGLCVPSDRRESAQQEALPLQRVEHAIQPWVALLILPLFGLANVGLSFASFTPAMVQAPVALGVGAGLFIGKQLGVFGTLLLATYTGIARLPEGASLSLLYGVAQLCGIGFTISLFISALAFKDAAMMAEAKVGIIAGSILSAACGYAWLWQRCRR